MTSFDAVAWTRRLLNVKKAGHCGTLDPDAAGVLPVCVGSATKIAGYLLDSPKSYRVEAVAGLLTDTLDTAGAILDRGSETMPDRGLFENALIDFLGSTEQTPPAYSAIKVGGRRMYELARKAARGTPPLQKPPPRPVEIYSLDTVHYGRGRVIFDVKCSKGTYVRALCRDLGERLGIYLCVSFLLRTVSAGLEINDAITVGRLSELARSGAVESAMIPADKILRGYERVELAETPLVRYMNGVRVAIGDFPPIDAGQRTVLVYHKNRFIGLGDMRREGLSSVTVKSIKFI
jgi:tRNA pseudouridine55 synthase